MKALTIRQPWAGLTAAGVKTIETRSWKTSYRGPIAVHAGALNPADGVAVGRWSVYRQADGTRALDTAGVWRALPLGAVVATATLTDCAPIGDPFSFRTGIHEGDEGDFPDQSVVVLHPPILGEDLWTLVHDVDGRQFDITEQLPYGDYTPGRWAWLLTDVTPIDPVPARGKQGLWNWDPS